MPVLDFPSAHIDDKAASKLPSVAFAILEGEKDPDRLSAIAAHDLANRDFIYTLSIMCSPEIHHKVEELNHALVSDELYHAVGYAVELGLRGSTDNEATLAIADRKDWKRLAGASLNNDWLAHIASGYALRWIVSRWRQPETQNDASLAKAAAVIEEWCRAKSIPGGGKQNITRNLWPRYRSVSHLWASLYMMNGADIDIRTVSGFTTFCSTAQWLLDQAIKIVPKGRRPGETIVSLDNTWAVPATYVPRLIWRTKDSEIDGGIVGYIWNNDLNAHDIRKTDRPPFLGKQV